MRRVVIFVVIFTMLSVGIFVSSPAEAISEQMFVLHGFAKCGRVLLSWESVPLSNSYIIYRDDLKLTDTTANETAFLDELVQTGEHDYKVIAKSESGTALSNSISAFVDVVCYDPFECDTDMKFVLGQKYYWVDETKKGPMPLPPLISQERTFLVIRYITNELGADISWDGKERKVTIVTIRGKVIELIIGNSTAIVNGEEIPIDPKDSEVVPVIESGRTLLPVRFVSDQMGAKEVIWDGEEKSITLRFHNDSICANQRLLLTVNNVSEQMIIASDTCGNTYQLPLDEDSDLSNQLKNGERILVDANVSDISSGGESSCVINLEAIDVSTVKNGKLVVGMVGNIYDFGNTGMLYLNNCGNETQLNFVIGLHGLESLAEGTWITAEISKANFVYDWNYIRNDIHCGLESNESIISAENLTASGLCYTSNNIQTDSIDNILYPSTEIDFDIIEDDSCYKIEYARNWLGRAIVMSMNEIDCGCNIQVIPINPNKVTILTGGKYEFKFDVINNTDEEKRLTVTVDGVDYFDGTVKVVPALTTIQAGEKKTIMLSVLTSEETTEPIGIIYNVICAGTAITNTLTLSALDIKPEYDIQIPEGMTINNNTQFVRIPFSVTNETRASLSMYLAFSSTGGIISKHRVEPKNAVIAPYETQDFVAVGEVKGARLPGESLKLILLPSTCGNSERVVIPIQIDRSGRAIVDVECTVDENGLATVTGNIDWRAFTKDKIQIRWGDDGEVEIIEGGLPVTHKYDESGIYSVRIYAKTLDWGQADSTGFGYCFAEYDEAIKDVCDDITIEQDSDDPRKFTISGSAVAGVDKITINWGDGEITGADRVWYSNGFEKEYTYQQFLRQEEDTEYLIHVIFLKNDALDGTFMNVVGFKKFRVTVPGLY